MFLLGNGRSLWQSWVSLYPFKVRSKYNVKFLAVLYMNYRKPVMVIIPRQIDQVQRQCQKQNNSMSRRGIYICCHNSVLVKRRKTGFVDPVNLRSNITVKSFLLCKNKSGGNNNKNNWIASQKCRSIQLDDRNHAKSLLIDCDHN